MPSFRPSASRPARSSNALLVVALVAGTIMSGGAPAASSSRPAQAGPRAVASQDQATAGEPIPLTPLAGLTSLDATVSINANGTLNGKPTTGDLTAQLSSNDQGQSQITVTGGLLGDVVAQVGGKAVKLFRPSKASVYTVADGTYVVLSGLFDVCFKPADSQATQALDQLSPQSLMTILTSSDVARGTLVGDDTVDGLAVKHYVIDGAAFLAAAQASSDPTVQLFGQSLTGATNADLYVAADGGYPVSYRGGFSGTFEPLAFSGDFTVQIDLTGINQNTPVVLPGACDHAIAG
jgi:hypothetical protein